MLDDIRRALETGERKSPKDILEDIDRLITVTADPNDRGYLLCARADCLSELGDFSAAREQLSLASREPPHDSISQLSVRFLGSLIDQREGNYQQAFDTFSDLLITYATEFKHPQVRWMCEDIQQRRGLLAVTLSKFTEAVAILNEALSFEVSSLERADLLASVGICHVNLRDWDLAKQRLLEAKDLGLTSERERRFHFYLGIAYSYTGLLREAKEEFLLCDSDPSCDAPRGDLYLWLSSVCQWLGQTQEAERYARLSKPV